MEFYTVLRTSGDTAKCDPVVLRQTETTRLVFKPLLVNNAQDSRAPLKGDLVFQHKAKGDDWEDRNDVSLASLRADEWVKIELKADEVHQLMHHIGALYRLYRRDKLPAGKTHFIRVDLGSEQARSMSSHDIGRLLALSQEAGSELLTRLLEWVGQLSNAHQALEQLEQLDEATLQQLNSLVGLTSLKALLRQWEEQRANHKEEFWQQLLAKNTFVLSQVLAEPVVLINGKAYVGGKTLSNTGGHVVDFLSANSITSNAVLVEIKTPVTPLLGKAHRTGAHSISEDLTAAVVQVLNYKHSLMTQFNSVKGDSGNQVSPFCPRCVVIAGNAGKELETEEQRRSFELQRGNSKDVLIITYDELFGKVSTLVEAIEGSGPA